jgi:hypothetical protein
MGVPRVVGGVEVVVGADDDRRAAPSVTHGASHWFEVVGVGGHHHRAAGGFVQAWTGVKALGDEDG